MATRDHGPATTDISIIVPTWNGLELLKRFLPPLLAEVELYQGHRCGAAEVLVIDDASSDGTLQYLGSQPVRIVHRSVQGGFSCACNTGIWEARFPIVVLLNNDVRMAPGFLRALVGPLADPAVFATTARIFEPESGLLATAGKIGKFRRGFWSVYFNYDCKRSPGGGETKLLPSAYAVGGFCAFRTEQAREWGGFDEIYSPFHWEDVDLSYRAWKRGWSVVYQPSAMGWHQAGSTIGRAFQNREVEIVAVRNRLLFHWKNLHDPVMLWQHVGMLLLLLLTRWLAGDVCFYRAFLGALRNWRSCLRGRRRERSAVRRSDRAVMKLLHAFGARPDIEIFRSRREVEQRCHERLRSPDYAQ